MIKLDAVSDQNVIVGMMLQAASLISTTAGKRNTRKLVPFVEDYQNHGDIVSGISLSNCVVCQLLNIHIEQTTHILVNICYHFDIKGFPQQHTWQQR